MEKIKFTIDGRAIEAQAGQTILEASLAAGIYIPFLCYHPDLPSTGDCLLCVVEVAGSGDLVVSCTAPVADGMQVITKSERLAAARRRAAGPRALRPATSTPTAT